MNARVNAVASKEQFESAPLGYAFMEACRRCTTPTGSIIVKETGKDSLRDPHGLPHYACFENSVCEFCQFLDMWVNQQEDKESIKAGKYRAAKLVDQQNELIAYVPLAEGEPTQIDFEDFKAELKHGSVFACVYLNENDFKINEVVEEGFEIYMEYDTNV